MVKRKELQRLSRMIGLVKIGNLARAVAKFILLLTVSLLSVQKARHAVRNVYAQQRSSGEMDFFVVPVVMISPSNLETQMTETDRICHGCESLAKRDGLLPRRLVKLPVEVTQDKVFNQKGIPAFLCEFCDAHELQLALAEHEKRINNK